MSKKIITFSLFCGIIILFSYFKTNGKEELNPKGKLPQLLGATNFGMEFWFTIPQMYVEGYDLGKRGIIIFATSFFDTEVLLEISAHNFYQKKALKAYDLVTFEITPTIGQPYVVENPQFQIWRGAAIRVTSKAPIVVFCATNFRVGSGSLAVLPVQVLGKDYRISTYNSGTPTCCIVAPYHSTRVKFTLYGNEQTQTTFGLKAGQTIEKVLDRGDVLVITGSSSYCDLTGSIVQSDKPVAVISSNKLVVIPPEARFGYDYIVEMNIPTNFWGKYYPIPNIAQEPLREKPPIIRILAKDKNTFLYRDGSEFAHLRCTNGFSGNGWIETRVLNNTPPFQHYPVLISSNNPISVHLYNTGIEMDERVTLATYSFLISLPSFEQYLKEYTFCLPQNTELGWFPHNYLSMIYSSDKIGYPKDDIMVGYYEEGKLNWEQLNKKIQRGNVYNCGFADEDYSNAPLRITKMGTYMFKSEKPFSLVAYGFRTIGAYGFLVGQSYIDKNIIDTLPPSPTWKFECGKITSASVVDPVKSGSQRSNLSLMFLHPYPESYNVEFEPGNFVPAESPSSTWNLRILDYNLDARAVITFADRSGNDTTILIEYSPFMVDVTPKELDWGIQPLNGNKVGKEFWLINRNEKWPASISNLYIKNNTSYFEIDLMSKKLPILIPPKDSVNFMIWFDPKKVGTFTDIVVAGDSCNLIYRPLLQATTGNPIIEVTDITFEPIKVGESLTKTFEISNTGNINLSVYGFTPQTNQINFIVKNLPPVTFNNRFVNELLIEPLSSLSFEVEFKPNRTGKFQDTIQFHSNASSNDSICILMASAVESPLGIYEELFNKKNNKDFYFEPVIPNPLTSEYFVVNFGIPSDGWTEIVIISARGEVAKRVVVGMMKAGDYNVRVNVDELSNGLYFITMLCDNYRAKKEFILMR